MDIIDELAIVGSMLQRMFVDGMTRHVLLHLLPLDLEAEVESLELWILLLKAHLLSVGLTMNHHSLVSAPCS